MEQDKVQPIPKTRSGKNKQAAIRVTQATQKKLLQLLSRANKKSYGKRVRADEIVSLALSLVSETHIKSLQNESLSNADKIDIQFKNYVRRNGQISKDQFLGKLHELFMSEMSHESK